MWFLNFYKTVLIMVGMVIALIIPMVNLFFIFLFVGEYCRRLSRIKNVPLWIVSGLLFFVWFNTGWLASMHWGSWMVGHVAYSVGIMLFMHHHLKKYGLHTEEID